MPVTTITHQEKKIVHVDCRGVSTQPEMLAMLRELRSYLEAREEGRVLVLTDVTDAYMGLDLMKELKGMSNLLEDAIEKDAILGLDAFKMIIVNGWNKFSKLHVKAFSSKPEALGYLVS